MSRYQLPDGNVIMANADYIAKTYPKATLLADTPPPVQESPEADPIVSAFVDLLVKAISALPNSDPAVSTITDALNAAAVKIDVSPGLGRATSVTP